MTVDLAPSYEHLTFMTPLSESRAAELTRFLAGSPEGRVVDVGCGWAELLLRVVEAAPQLRGTGIDLDADGLAHGRRLAETRGVADRIELRTGDARTGIPSDAVSLICIGASQIWSTGDDEPCNYDGALTALRDAVPRGGRVLYGEGVWTTTPTARATAPLSGRADEYVGVGELLDLAAAHGFMPLAVHEANRDEWDAFESGYAAPFARWIAEHPADHADAAGVRARAAEQRAAYFDGYRGVLGLAYLCLVAV